MASSIHCWQIGKENGQPCYSRGSLESRKQLVRVKINIATTLIWFFIKQGRRKLIRPFFVLLKIRCYTFTVDYKRHPRPSRFIATIYYGSPSLIISCSNKEQRIIRGKWGERGLNYVCKRAFWVGVTINWFIINFYKLV